MSLHQVAQRIHERNNALATEQATLELLQDQIDLAKKRLNADQLATQSVRKELLTVLRLRHGVEFDCIQLTEEAAKIDESTAAMQASINGIRLKTNELRKKFEEEQAPIYSAHDVSITLHAMQSESILVRAQRKKQRREEMLSHLRQQTDRQRAEAESMREEMGRIRDALLELDRREEEEDEEMVGLTMQIRQVLAKVRQFLQLNEVFSLLNFCDRSLTSSFITENINSTVTQQCKGGAADCSGQSRYLEVQALKQTWETYSKALRNFARLFNSFK
jgi:chromosome segregation ATPase